MPKDPAFLFYPADASEDTQFMNRLERGCYFDILKAQKKFRKFSLPQLKKVLGNDFEICWPALELVLKFENGFYFIEWADDSLQKRKLFSESRSKNRKKVTSDEHMNNICETRDKDMVNENEIINEDKNFEKSEKLLIPALSKIFIEKNEGYLPDHEKDFPALRKIAIHIGNKLGFKENSIFSNKDEQHAIKLRWGEIVTFIHSENFFRNYSLSQVEKHFQSILLKKENGNSQTFKPKNGKSSGADELIQRVGLKVM